ncbi:excisionase [Burkholderia gladioli]|uniref:excisionase n=1 Tax=Burkholderia gladioli TaxID=28095 RepID=UPI001586AEDF|nr:excisionase [Burkholderia gladioli]
MSERLIPIAAWAKNTFGEHAPHANTLRRWAQLGKILPVPKLIGRGYFCNPDAEYFDARSATIDRMLNGRSSSKR